MSTLVERLEGLLEREIEPAAKDWERRNVAGKALLRFYANEIKAMLTDAAALRATGEGEWPTEAKRDGPEWSARTAIAHHSMSEAQALVWNACRAACLAACKRSAAPTPAEPLRDAGDDLKWLADHDAGLRLAAMLRGDVLAGDFRNTLAEVIALAKDHPAPQQPAITDAMVERALKAYWADCCNNNQYADSAEANRAHIRAALTAAQEKARG